MEDIIGEIIRVSWDLRVRRRMSGVGIEMERIYGIKKDRGWEVNGKKEGSLEKFYENKKLWYRGNYTNGKREGLCEMFYGNGKILWRGNFRNGKEEGTWEWFYGSGEISRRINYRNGVIIE